MKYDLEKLESVKIINQVNGEVIAEQKVNHEKNNDEGVITFRASGQMKEVNGI